MTETSLDAFWIYTRVKVRWDSQRAQEEGWSRKDSRRSVSLDMNHRLKRKKKEPETTPPPSPLFTWTDEDQAYVNKMLMKDARRNLRKKIDAIPKHPSDYSG